MIEDTLVDEKRIFGEFTLDVSEGLLFQGQERIPVRPQAMKVLVYLVEHHGTLVPRRELANMLWADARLDEDQGINAIIRNLRKILGDDPSSPTYIETVPTKGYRFIAACSSDDAVIRTSIARSNSVKTVAAFSLLLAIAVIGVLGFRALRPPPLTLDEIPPAARQSYVEGLKRFQQWGQMGVVASRAKFERVVEMAPRFPEGHLYLGKSYLYSKGTNLALAQQAEPHIREALRLKPELPGAYVALGRIAMIKDLDVQLATQLTRKALTLDPRNTDALELLSSIRLVLGDQKGGLDFMKQVDDSNPLRMSDTARRGWVLFYSGEYELAVRECRNSIKVDTYNPYARLCLFEAYFALGAVGLARQEAVTMMIMSGASSFDVQFVESASPQEALQRFWSWRLNMVRAREGKDGDLYPLIVLYLRLDQADEAVALINRIVAERHYASLLRLSMDGRLDDLADNPDLQFTLNQFQQEEPLQ